ncbi:hypothetical protein S40288_07885 [Stachybotrys chartarum IBT 40288]|nr:hypothetical protein S40288_07885 [Stachybotrys chartarum IBT 40288]
MAATPNWLQVPVGLAYATPGWMRLPCFIKNRAVEIILTSSNGDILNDLWRINADGGTFVEIGKDIVDPNSLPVDRKRATGLSYTIGISDAPGGWLLHEILKFVNHGHAKLIHPITTLGFDDIPSAIVFIHSGRHIGKNQSL